MGNSNSRISGYTPMWYLDDFFRQGPQPADSSSTELLASEEWEEPPLPNSAQGYPVPVTALQVEAQDVEPTVQ